MITSDPIAKQSIHLLGGEYFESISFSHDQMRAFCKLYTIESQADNLLNQAVDKRNLFRLVKLDGLRLMGVLAKFCDAGEDPVKALVSLLMDKGYDVGDLCEWIDGE